MLFDLRRVIALYSAIIVVILPQANLKLVSSTYFLKSFIVYFRQCEDLIVPRGSYLDSVEPEENKI